MILFHFAISKEKGFTSIRELKRLQLNMSDFNEGEKERMRPLLASLQTNKSDSSSGTHAIITYISVTC